MTVSRVAIELLKEHKLFIALMLVVTTIWAIDISFRQYLIKQILDATTNLQNSGNVIEHLAPPAILYICMALLITTIYRIYGYFIDIIMCPLLKQQLTDKAYWALLNRDSYYYQENFTGDLVHKLNDLTESIIELLKLVIDRFLGCIIAVTISIYTLSLVSIKFALITSCWIALFSLTIYYFFPVLASLARQYSYNSAKVTAKSADSLYNIRSIILFNNKRFERLQLIRQCKNRLYAERKVHRAYFWVWFIDGYSFDLLQIITLYCLVIGFQNSQVTAGDFALVIGLNLAIGNILNVLTNDLTKFSDYYGKATDATSSIFAGLKEQNYNINENSFVITAGQICFENITFAYKGNERLFEDLSVTINAKEKIGLVGKSGSGKSSFISLILGLYPLDSGQITIDNQLIAESNYEQTRAQISVVPQDISLFCDSIANNIRYGKLIANNEEIREAARFAGIDGFIQELPEGYNTIVGERGVKLSGGQRQRVSLARAFLKNSKILILDEATNQQDNITEKEIQGNILQLIQNKTTIIIAHRLSTLRCMDRILVFKDGKIIQDGSHEQLMQCKGFYQELYQAQDNDILQY